MNPPPPLHIDPPALPKMGGAIQSIGKGWAPVGTRGEASQSIALPISPGRGYAPKLWLAYASQSGNSTFGMGWGLPQHEISLRTSQGTPRYDGSDQIMGPSGDVWMPERSEDGALIARQASSYRGESLGTQYQIVRHWPRVEGDHALIEHWSAPSDLAGFWLVHSSDGSLHIYGKTRESRRFNTQNPDQVGAWLLCESMDASAQHIVYEYMAETDVPAPPQLRDYRSQRYLKRVCYGNSIAFPHLYAWKENSWKNQLWHFQLVFDYAQRSTDLQVPPSYAQSQVWQTRSDPFWNYAYGFELGTRRLCRQVLMFHHFPDDLGPIPVLTQRLLLEYRQSSLGYSLLSAFHVQAYDSLGQVESRPPTEYHYNEFTLHGAQWKPLAAPDDTPELHLVDLYGEGLPGMLYRVEGAWYYREPLRDTAASDAVSYSPWQRLERTPVANSRQRWYQSLTDLTGNGKLDWVIAAPGLKGFFTLSPNREWSNFVPFEALPNELLEPSAQMADLIGTGLSDITLIGPRSVRLYANQRDAGFARGIDVPHPADSDSRDELPIFSDSQTELVAFSDLLGCASVQLVRIRSNEIKCWPSLGGGRFGDGFVWSALPFASETFNASQVLLADLDGSGAADLLYLTYDAILVFMNQAGNGYPATPSELPWPAGMRYDRSCQVSTADLYGSGRSSLIVSSPLLTPRHWHLDLNGAKPYLMNASCNNMGSSTQLIYRSSAQEWLDEKQAPRVAGSLPPVARLPLVVQLVKQLVLIDEVTENRLTQTFTYREGYHDGVEREFRGFGLLLQGDTEASEAERAQTGFSAPVLTKTWFHTGESIDRGTQGFSAHDPLVSPLKPTLLHNDQAMVTDPLLARDIARSLSGRTLRTEVSNADDLPADAVPYTVVDYRYRVSVQRPRGNNQPYAIVMPLVVETRSYQYEPQIPDDPLCQHALSLEWDQFGNATRTMTVHYPRRKVVDDAPPFSDQHQRRWWRDAHDEAQQTWHLQQDKAQFIHHQGAEHADVEAWRLNLPYLQRSNFLTLEKAALAPEDISHENVLHWSRDDGEWANLSVLGGLSRQFYMDPSNAQVLPAGRSTFEALTAYHEHAELDATALQAFDRLKDADNAFDLMALLQSPQAGYHIMDLFLPTVAKLPASNDAKNYLWSLQTGFPIYASGFHHLLSYRETRSHGETRFTYDKYQCLVTEVRLPDGCTTRTLDIDYRTLLPTTIEDPNRNIQQARYSAFGEPYITTFHGTERGVATGFQALERYEAPPDRTPATALANKESAIGKFASAGFWDLFCWMGQIPDSLPHTSEWRAWAIEAGFILPSGHFYDRARRYLDNVQTLSVNEQALKRYIHAARREPVNTLTLVSDQYPDTPGQRAQIRATITCLDGFGRHLQTKREVERGAAWLVDDQGQLLLNPDGTPQVAEVPRRWWVSQPVEYNNKGLPVREYRSYFADRWSYIDDRSMRAHALHDQHFYDARGRLVSTLLAKTMLQGDPPQQRPLRREIWYWLWNNVMFDENDLFDAPPTKQRQPRELKR
ncbi:MULTISPECIES: SpvB/TcaC N-terminal domain-containing protein [Pseudomonas]|uniref:Toxin n=1 Tax=Pseudomonas azadiae TaxID=2843612 RepID=A0ABS6NW05_9PSED|nr:MULTISPECIES: SpvB/TcaC N-terminal domain-containing protein [Pseudomonas]MBV4452394.1 toxin [Pseudomonas azadiae]NMF42259.1 toxin [Pseudomonas sp. SWRI 103]